MIIIDRKKIIIKKIVIGVIVLLVLLAVGFAVWRFFIKAKKTATPASETASVSNTVSPNETNGTSNTGSPPPQVQAENQFRLDLGECIKKFTGLENMTSQEVDKLKSDIVSINITKARDYYVCQAVKNDDSKYCDAVKADGESYTFCQNEYLQVSGMMFPALKSNSCDQQIIDVCKRTGGADCDIICQGLYLGNVDECNKLKDGNPLKGACLAINQKDTSPCSALKSADDQGICQEEYYFIRAAKENNSSLLDSIENISERTIVKLFFDKNYRCEKILAGFGENACNKKYNIDYLQTLKNSAEASQGNDKNK
ncbi:hypothetical protein D4R99_03105 [bacterium]|nr:MAG: hypothetical protein D4R99_03105 [bacterium]